MVILLIEKGANLNAQDKDGKTPLHWASSNAHDSSAVILIKRGASLFIKDQWKKTFLMSAYDGKKFQFLINTIFPELLSMEVFDEVLKMENYSLLWHACKDGHLDLVKALPKNLLNKEAPDRTLPHFMAFIKGHSEIVKYLNQFFKIPIKYEETPSNETDDSFMVKLTKKIPVFNDQVEKKYNFKIPKHILYDDLDEHILGPLCPMKKVNLKTDPILYVQKIDPMECDVNCRQ